jgi:UDP-N-acetylmuramoylalanine--D-glutamate ligase
MREPIFDSLPRPPQGPLDGRQVLVLGLGDTGLSAAKWIAEQGGKVRAADTRAAPPRAAEFRAALPWAEMHCGAFAPALLEGADMLCVSPGVSLSEPLIRAAVARGLPVLGDVELFAWAVRGRAASKVVAVTGTNGKSTVTALTGHLLRAAGIDSEVAGNIGPAVLEALLRPRMAPPAAWVLELSSFQLETTWSLGPEAAAMLNLSEDHLDRYAGMADYAAAKARVFMGEGVQVLNRDDPRSMALARPGRRRISFGLDAPPAEADFGLVSVGGTWWLAQGGNVILEAAALAIHGRHNAANALAACALARTVGASYESLAEGLRTFKGLPHRLERVATRRGVDWYDDSKGTNVGAAIAALRGLGRSAVLIAGGDGKGQDFAPLAPVVAECASRVLLIGRDAPRIAAALAPSGVPLERCHTLEEAVETAARSARPGEAVLLSPACASFDMFRDYRHRGEAFALAVRGLGE